MTFYRHANAFFAIPSAVRHARLEDTTFSRDDVPGKTAGDFQATRSVNYVLQIPQIRPAVLIFGNIYLKPLLRP
jgi:hypothetical protein